MKLYVIRHAQSLLNIGEGKTPNCGLSEFGNKQAEYISTFFKNIPVDAIYSSPLRRVIQTAYPLATQKKLNIQLAPEMCEFFHDQAFDYRDYDWEKTEDIEREFEYASFNSDYQDGKWWPNWPENRENVEQRVARFYQQEITKYFGTNTSVVVFGHGASTGELKGIIDRNTMDPAPNAVIYEYLLNDKGERLSYKDHVDFLEGHTFNLGASAY
ncbi:histidine phosphatase family protein [Amphibacillus sp. Q70]|uniref:histidine phosphatase family protein n=1 Tax=Amphibacillus sp. Q70 TaxID=3453416 RepID=UPI003F829134